MLTVAFCRVGEWEMTQRTKASVLQAGPLGLIPEIV